MPPAIDDAPTVSYPRFAHGEELYVFVGDDGSVEFRSDAPDEFIRTDGLVDLRDEI